MDKYIVKLYAHAYQDLDNIYTYIADNFFDHDLAMAIIDKLENAIFSLEQYPERGAIKKCI